jgi:hypothetical protein
MGSIAQDQDGNMLLGYSVSDAIDVFPGIRYTGRLAGDELGKMTLCEGTLIDGGGSQQSTRGRWGDYSSMNIDPSDDCTFWYTNEYYETSSDRGWKTRIGSFTMPECGKTSKSVAHSKGTKSKGKRKDKSKDTKSKGTKSKDTKIKGTKSNDTKSKGTKSKGTKSKDTKSKGTKSKGSDKGKGKGYPVSAKSGKGKGYRVRRRDE